MVDKEDEVYVMDDRTGYEFGCDVNEFEISFVHITQGLCVLDGSGDFQW